jgi:hypothetical protein
MRLDIAMVDRMIEHGADALPHTMGGFDGALFRNVENDLHELVASDFRQLLRTEVMKHVIAHALLNGALVVGILELRELPSKPALESLSKCDCRAPCGEFFLPALCPCPCLTFRPEGLGFTHTLDVEVYSPAITMPDVGSHCVIFPCAVRSSVRRRAALRGILDATLSDMQGIADPKISLNVLFANAEQDSIRHSSMEWEGIPFAGIDAVMQRQRVKYA